MEINLTSVGKRIKNIRLSLGEAMDVFGERFDTSKGAVNNWEKGRNLPNKKKLLEISSLGNISIDELLYGNIYSFIEEYISENLSDDESYLKDYLSEESIISMARFMLENNISYSEIENLTDHLNEIKAQSFKIFDKHLLSKVKSILDNQNYVRDHFFDAQNNDVVDIFKNPEKFIDFLKTSSPNDLSEYDDILNAFYINLRLNINSTFKIKHVEYFILSEDDYLDNGGLKSAKKALNKISIMDIKSSLRGYDKVFAFYIALFETSYIAAIYEKTETPLIDGVQYIFEANGALEVGKYSSLKNCFIRQTFGLEFDPNDSPFFAPILNIMY